MSPQGDVTRLLHEVTHGNKAAQDQLISLVYKELHRIAEIQLRKERAGHSLQPTALVNEAYLRFANIEDFDWQCRSHFFAVSAMIMRRILVDHARAYRAEKRGDGMTRIEFDDAIQWVQPKNSPDVLVINDALERLAEFDERAAKVVEMKFFGGMTEEEIALALGVASRTVKRDWRIARAGLYQELDT